VFSGFPHLESG